MELSYNQLSVQGICYDEKSSYLQGAAQAPELIRKALQSGSMNDFTELGTEIRWNEIEDRGDFKPESYFDIEKRALQTLEEKPLMFSWGGDHSISYPLIKAVAEKYGKLDILHIDAHGDLYDDFEGDRYSHACPFARIMEDGLASRLVQVGIRALNPHQWAQVEKFGVEVHEARHCEGLRLSPFQHPVYISLDLDGLDPAYAPGVSHHEPGGLSTRQVLDLIHQVQGRVVGADLVEYNPSRDHQDMTAFLAAKLTKELIGRMLK